MTPLYPDVFVADPGGWFLDALLSNVRFLGCTRGSDPIRLPGVAGLLHLARGSREVPAVAAAPAARVASGVTFFAVLFFLFCSEFRSMYVSENRFFRRVRVMVGVEVEVEVRIRVGVELIAHLV